MLRSAAVVLFVAVVNCRATAPVASASPAGGAPALQSPVDQLIPWLLEEDRQLRGIAFSEVIFDTTGKRVIAVERGNEVDQRVIKQISGACDLAIERLNAPDSPVQNVARINEVSSHFEDRLRELLSSTPGLSCDFPRTSDGKVQRSGYPDLRIVDVASKRVFYLDPKLYAAGSRDSSFRTFYFEPKGSTNKVREDAVHFIVGFEHEPRDVAASLSRGASDQSDSTNTATERRDYNMNKTRWKFTRWDLVDLAQFKVKLKAEFQASNRDLYRPEATVATSGNGQH